MRRIVILGVALVLELATVPACAPFDPDVGTQQPAVCENADGGIIDAASSDACSGAGYTP